MNFYCPWTLKVRVIHRTFLMWKLCNNWNPIFFLALTFQKTIEGTHCNLSDPLNHIEPSVSADCERSLFLTVFHCTGIWLSVDKVQFSPSVRSSTASHKAQWVFALTKGYTQKHNSLLLPYIYTIINTDLFRLACFFFIYANITT